MDSGQDCGSHLISTNKFWQFDLEFGEMPLIWSKKESEGGLAPSIQSRVRSVVDQAVPKILQMMHFT